MLLWCLQDGYTALIYALQEGYRSLIECLIFEGNADYSDCNDDKLVKEALVKYRQTIMASLDLLMPVPGLCAIVTGYC